MGYLIAAALFLYAVWVFFDAYKLRKHTLREAVGWALGTLAVWLFVVPLYFAQRHLRAGETREGGDGWNYLKTLAVLWTIVMLAVGAHYILAASEVVSTAHTSAGQAGAAIGATLGLGVVAAAWFFPVLGALLLGLVLKKASIVEKGPTGPLALQVTGAMTPGLTACPTCGSAPLKGMPCPTCGRSASPERKRKGTMAVVGIMTAALVVGLVAVGLLKGLGTASELREEKHPNGSLKSRGHVRRNAEKNYVLVGLWTYWFPNGQKEAEGEYRNGREDGKRGDTGILMDGRNGPWTIWHENGQKRQVSEYRDGTPVGTAETWYENGQKESEGRVEDGKKEGVWTYWYKNGQKEMTLTDRHGTLVGAAETWYENGQKKNEGQYKDGKEEGVWTYWHENGQKKSEGRYEDGKEEGAWTYWHENGQKKMTLHYEHGNKAGVFQKWYENGQKEAEGELKDGAEDGLWTLWHQNGQKEMEAKYAQGQIVGPSRFWSEDGRRVRDSAPAALSAEPTVATDDSDPLQFGKPTVRDTGFGMTRVMVQARNVTDRPITCVVTATFMKGDTILGTANGTVNAVSASSVKTAELMSTDRIRGYDTVRLETGGCF